MRTVLLANTGTQNKDIAADAHFATYEVTASCEALREVLIK
jgi:hypothetical protein